MGDKELEITLAKARMLGICEDMTFDGGVTHLIKKSEEDSIWLIPFGIRNIDLKSIEPVRKVKGRLSVIGGTSLVNGNYLFCESKAEELNLEKFNISNMKDMDSMFWSCRAKKIEFGAFDTKYVKFTSDMFNGCEAEELDLSWFNTASVVNMNSMFYNCCAKKINLKGFNTEQVVYMDSMFYGCKAKELDLSSFNTKNVKDMTKMFNFCFADKIDLSSFDTTNVKYMYDMFLGCNAEIKATDPKILREMMGVEMYDKSKMYL